MQKAHPYQLENKLSPKWNGPFRVVKVLRNGAYRLETLKGESFLERGTRQISSLFQRRYFGLMLSFEKCDDKGDALFPLKVFFNEVIE